MPPESSSRTLPRWLILMGALTAIGPFSIDMYLPAFPVMAQDLGVPLGDIERTLAAYLVGVSLAQVVYGPLADRYGRKPPVIAGLLLYTLAAVGGALADSAEALTAWRLMQALGGAVGMVIPRAVIRDHYATQDAARAMSMLMLIMGLAPMLAPLAGGQLLLVASWRSLFWLMALLGLALLCAVTFIMRESLTPERVIPLKWASILSNYRSLLGHRRFIAHSLAGGLGMAGMFAYIAGSPHVFIEVYGVPEQYYGLLFGVNAMMLIAGAQCSAYLLRRHPSLTLQGWALRSLAITGLVGLFLAVTGLANLWLTMACILAYMFSQGFVNPNSAALALSEQGHRLGVASAMMGTLQFLCGSVAGLFVSLWQADSSLPLAVIMACSASLAWQAGRVARREASI